MIVCLGCLLAGLANAAGPGEKTYQAYLENGGLYDDPEWQAYVDEIGQRLVKVTKMAGDEFHFYVLDDTSVNAFALPDGYIFVHRGLIAYVRSEDELAGVIGHEIGHVVGHHAKRANVLGAMGTVAGIVGSILTGTGAISDLSNTATATLTSGYRRDLELEADQYGAEFLARAGYNPLSMIDVIQVLKDQSMFAKNVLHQPQVYHGLFASHPKNDKRLHEAVEKSLHLFPDELQPTERDFWKMIDGMVYGNAPTTGLIKGSTYYHGGLRVVLGFPEGWDVSNTASEVIGKAPLGTDIRITVLRQNPPAEEQTPAEYIEKTLKRDDVENGKDIQVNGYAAHTADVKIAAGNAVAKKIAVIYKDGGVYLFNGELGPNGGTQADFDAAWLKVLGGFRAMTADDLKVANDQRIAVVMAKPSDTFASLARKSSLKDYPEETLRVINGLYPNGEPRAGDYIKIVQ
ncbi:MAG: M48 family metalloprotease [Pseudomonadales bacterium]|jgi:predicted Zn-dependent protease